MAAFEEFDHNDGRIRYLLGAVNSLDAAITSILSIRDKDDIGSIKNQLADAQKNIKTIRSDLHLIKTKGRDE